MRRSPYISLAIAAGIILLLSLVFFGRYLPYAGAALTPKEPPAVVLEMRGAYFIGLNDGRKVWSVKARSVEIGQNRSLTSLAGITQGKIFDRGKLVLRVEAGHAQYNSTAGDLLMDRGITIYGADGQSLKTDGAYWNSATSTLRSNGRVRFRSDWATATSDQMLVNMQTQEMTMRNVVISVDLAKGVEQNAL